MLIAGIALLAFFLLLPIVLMASSGRKGNKELLHSLGLSRSWSKDKSTAFYNWGWRKQSGERVWGERVVKEAFRKANVWLSPEDLDYFQGICEEREKGQEVNRDKVIRRIESIVKREESLEDSIKTIINKILSQVSTITEQEANKILQESGINLSGKDRIIQRYGSNEFRKVITDAAFHILSSESKGFQFTSSGGSRVYSLVGMEAWERWHNLFKDICMKQNSSKKIKQHQKAFKNQGP